MIVRNPRFWMTLVVMLCLTTAGTNDVAVARAIPPYALGLGFGLLQSQNVSNGPVINAQIHFNLKDRISIETAFTQWWENSTLNSVARTKIRESIVGIHILYRVIRFHRSSWIIGTGWGFHFTTRGVTVRDKSRSIIRTRLGFHYFSSFEFPIHKSLFGFARGRVDIVDNRTRWFILSGFRYRF